MTIAEKLSKSNKVTLSYEFRPRPGNVADEDSSTSESSSQSDTKSSESSNRTCNYKVKCKDTGASSNGNNSGSQQSSSLNFSTGVSAECLTALVGANQLMEARERIKKVKSDGDDLSTRLKNAKRITAGFCWKEGPNRLGKTVFEVCKDKQKQKEQEQNELKLKEEKTYLELKEKADAILASGKAIDKMSNKELSTIRRSLKRNGDKQIPTKKQEMISFYYYA